MECLNQQAVLSRFQINIAHCSGCHPPVVIKEMSHSPKLTILTKLLLKGPENFLGHHFQLEAGLVFDAPAIDNLIPFTSNWMSK